MKRKLYEIAVFFAGWIIAGIVLALILALVLSRMGAGAVVVY